MDLRRRGKEEEGVVANNGDQNANFRSNPCLKNSILTYHTQIFHMLVELYSYSFKLLLFFSKLAFMIFEL